MRSTRRFSYCAEKFPCDKFTFQALPLYCLKHCINIHILHGFHAICCRPYQAERELPFQSDSDASASPKRDRFLALAEDMRTLWRANALGRGGPAAITTGYSALDAELPGGGWAPSSLTELLWAHQGGGEFRVLAPALRAVAQSGRTVVILGSPHELIAPGLDQAGIDVGRVLLVRADKPADRLWSAEQILKSGCVGALVSWQPMAKAEHLRRLQVAASTGEGLVFVFRPASTRHEPSPAPLRLACAPAPFGCLSVEVFKRRGPAAASAVLLPPLFAPSMMRALERSQKAIEQPVENKNVDRLLFPPATAGSDIPALA